MSNTEQFKHITSPSRKTLLSLLEKFPDALFVVDDDATILYANTSAQAMTGVTREDLFGKPLWDSAPWLVGASLY